MATVNLGKVCMIPKGEWSSATTYAKLDFVTKGGSSWVSLVDNNLNHEPSVLATTYWQALAAASNVSVTSQTYTYTSQLASEFTGDPPQSGWSSTIPVVSGGDYLWTKITTTFSDASSFNAYYPVKYGVNGTGAVSSVNGVSPDANGNVLLQITNIATVDSTPTEGSTNLVTSGGVLTRIYAAVSGLLSKITTGSGNRVYIHNGSTQSDLGFDSTPTADSSNLLTSGVTYLSLMTKQNTITSTTVTLDSDEWTDNSQTVSVTGLLATDKVTVSPAPASFSAYASAVIYCSGQAAGTLTFTCTTVPENDVTVNLMIVG